MNRAGSEGYYNERGVDFFAAHAPLTCSAVVTTTRKYVLLSVTYSLQCELVRELDPVCCQLSYFDPVSVIKPNRLIGFVCHESRPHHLALVVVTRIKIVHPRAVIDLGTNRGYRIRFLKT